MAFLLDFLPKKHTFWNYNYNFSNSKKNKKNNFPIEFWERQKKAVRIKVVYGY